MADVKRINLALQGGGAHGAFTWGVLDRLLEDPEIEIAAMSGTSAGALNGAAVKAGLTCDRDAARENLTWLWEQIGASDAGGLTGWMQGVAPGTVATALEYSPLYAVGESLSRMISPYSWGPLYRHPLRPIVDAFDFSKVCAGDGPALFICATRVRNGKIKVFEGKEITTDAILASACLPTLFQAVEIHDEETGRDEAFWDEGYTGNPALFPMFREGLPHDVVIININPLERDAVPVTPQQIQNRINEISFNSSLLRELRAINFVQRLLDEGKLKPGEMNHVLVHMIADDDFMNDLSVATKTVPLPFILNALKEAGQAAAHRFLAEHKSDLGQNSTVDLKAMFS